MNAIPPLFGMYKELWIENATQLKEAYEKWDQQQLKVWLTKMEKNILTFHYDECIQLLNDFQPNFIENLPNQLSEQCNKLRNMFQNNQTQFLIVSNYLQLLRNLKKSLEPIHYSNNLVNAIQNLELFLSSPLNQNIVKPVECNCLLI